ncbi:unnamed protein product [Leptosia nina]|uniref:Uncharacterized protein n=1 Tax=Leptosia nina TaxID=320188 RepID=A0AAV1JRG1_9NEOP
MTYGAPSTVIVTIIYCIRKPALLFSYGKAQCLDCELGQLSNVGETTADAVLVRYLRNWLPIYIHMQIVWY